MIKIRGNFIQATDGCWHNLGSIRSLYIGGGDEVGYRICFAFEHDVKQPNPTTINFMSIGETHKLKEDAQDQLDGVMELLEYEKN